MLVPDSWFFDDILPSMPASTGRGLQTRELGETEALG